MIVRSLAPKLPLPTPSVLHSYTRLSITSSVRHHSSYPPRPVPPPTAFVPDVATFLTLIGRQLSQHISKFNTWESLFSATSPQLRNLGIEPPRNRRYLIWWREKYRRGEFGVGGDMLHVKDGVGEIRAVEGEGKKPLAINTPPAAADGTVKTEEGATVKGFKVLPSGVVVGKHVQPIKGTLGKLGTLTVTEGLWEVKRGKKIHGGERRRKYNLSVLRRKAKAAEK